MTDMEVERQRETKQRERGRGREGEMQKWAYINSDLALRMKTSINNYDKSISPVFLSSPRDAEVKNCT